MRIQELVSEDQYFGGFLRIKRVFMAEICFFSDFFLLQWPFLHQSPRNFGSRAEIGFSDHLNFIKGAG